MAPKDFLTLLRSELRAAVREEVDAALARRWPVRSVEASAPAPAPDPGTPLADALSTVARRATPDGRAYVVLGDVLLAMGIPAERHHHRVRALAAELARLGWEHGERLRPAGVDGPRVVAWYPPQ